VAKDWLYIEQCIKELAELLEEASRIDLSNTRDVYYYEIMTQIALEELEFEIRR
jgi:hypothetical protein